MLWGCCGLDTHSSYTSALIRMLVVARGTPARLGLRDRVACLLQRQGTSQRSSRFDTGLVDQVADQGWMRLFDRTVALAGNLSFPWRLKATAPRKGFLWEKRVAVLGYFCGKL